MEWTPGVTTLPTRPLALPSRMRSNDCCLFQSMLCESGGKQRGICSNDGNQQPEHERDEDGNRNHTPHSGLLLEAGVTPSRPQHQQRGAVEAAENGSSLTYSTSNPGYSPAGISVSPAPLFPCACRRMPSTHPSRGCPFERSVIANAAT